MQKGKVFRLQSFGFIEFFKKNSFLFIMTMIFAIGVIIGVFTIGSFDYLKDYSKEYISDYITLRQSSFGSVLFNSLLSSLSVLFLFFLLGASLFGVVTVPSCILLKGLLQGGVTAYLYSIYGIKGIAFNTIILIPSTFIFIIVLLVACRESVKFSLKFSSLTLNKTLPFNMSEDFKDYSIKYLILAVCCFVCALVDAAISVGLIKHFTL